MKYKKCDTELVSITMSSLCLSSIDEALAFATLKRDVMYMAELFMSDCDCDIDPSKFMMSRNKYSNPAQMYSDILRIVGEIGLGPELLEMMPFIDDYLEYYFS